MAFLSEIGKKKTLKPTTTKVRLRDGTLLEEKKGADGQILTTVVGNLQQKRK